MLSETEPAGRWSTEWRGRQVVCPSNLRLRVLESTVAFAAAYRSMGTGLIPEDAAVTADRELRSYHRRRPNDRSHVLASAWHVPVRWFTAFDPSEREIYDGPNGPRIRFRTGIEDAIERSSKAHQVLVRLGVFQGPAEELGQLVEWLAAFPANSMLELDYDDVSDLFESQELIFDDSCELVNQSVKALAEGDMMRAGENYGRVVSRWAPAFSVTFSN
jgi:hypothetical protein